MANVTLEIAGRAYPITCGDGEEDHARSLAALLDTKISEATNGQSVTEIRGLLFGGLLLADALKEADSNIRKGEAALRKATTAVETAEKQLINAEPQTVPTDEQPHISPDDQSDDGTEHKRGDGLLDDVVQDAMVTNAVKALEQLAERIETLADTLEKSR